MHADTAQLQQNEASIFTASVFMSMHCHMFLTVIIQNFSFRYDN